MLGAVRSPDPTRVVHRRPVAGFELLETIYPPLLRQPRHTHDRASLTLILGGALQERVVGGNQECSAASLVFKPAGLPHENVYGPVGARTLTVQLPASRPSGPEAIGPERYEWQHGGPFAARALALYREFQSSDQASELALESLVHEFLAYSGQGPDQVRAGCGWLARLEDHLHEDFQQPLSMRSLAEGLGIHPVYLARAFRSRHRCTLGEYVRRLRLQWSAREVTQTDRPLSHIALEAGFTDQPHFSRAFKALLGVPPGRFRRRMRGAAE